MKVFISENIKKENPLVKFSFIDFVLAYGKKNLTEDQIEYAKEFIKKNNKDIYPFFVNLLNIFNELKKYNLSFSDVINPNNYGIKSGHWAIFDIGYGMETKFDVDVDNTIDENEDDYILINGAKVYKKTPQSLREKIFNHFNIKNADYLNSGGHGDVYQTSNNRLIKITNDANEAVQAKKIIGNNLEYVANIYGLYKIQWNYSPYYVLFIEKINANKNTPKRFYKLWKKTEDIFDVIGYGDLQLNYADTFNIIKNKSINAANFLKNLYFKGFEGAYENFDVEKSGGYIDDIDLNDLYDISTWIVGSKTNDHYYKDEVPDDIIRTLNKLK